MSYTEALARVAQIETELEALTGGTPAAESGSQSFAQTLASAQAASETQAPASTGSVEYPASAAPASETSLSGAPAETLASGDELSFLAADSQLAPAAASAWQDPPLSDDTTLSPSDDTTLSPSYDTMLSPSDDTTLSTEESGATSAPAGLPVAAQQMLTSGQQQFAARLAADTGLDPGVVSAWLLAEESGGAAAGREAEANNDWLNIGYTDSGTYGSADSVWSDPVTAADATAGWLSGHETIAGYGTASSGIEGILATAGQAPQQQIAAIQDSGWASSGYPDLPSLFQDIAG